MAQQANNGGKKKNTVSCMGCGDELDIDHTGTICISNHHICTKCSKNFINVIFESPEQNIPVKCMICKQEVVINTFERQLTQKQAQMFVMYNMQYNPKSLLTSDEIVASCPFCSYFEINTQDPGRLLFICKNKGDPNAKPDPVASCCKNSCFWCKKEIKNKANVSNEQKVDMDENEVEKHFKCVELAVYKSKWDKAIEVGVKLECPGCGSSGQKDGACTHMGCLKCQTKWCYCCGLKFEDCDKRQGVPGWAAHNNNWETNPKRCPMYLHYINKIDKRWPEPKYGGNYDAQDDCVAFLHRLKCFALLKKAIEEMGDEIYTLLCATYDVDKNCGYDMKEVMEGDHTLIKRPVISHEDKQGDNVVYEADGTCWQ